MNKINKNLALILFVLSTTLILGSTVDAFAVDPDGRGSTGTGSIEACLNIALPPNNFSPCDTSSEWSGGNISNDAGYKEGSSIPMRVDITGLETTAPWQILVIDWQITKKNGPNIYHAFDYITSYDRNDTPHPCLVAIPGEPCEFWDSSSKTLPVPTANTLVGANTTLGNFSQPITSFTNLDSNEKLFWMFSPNGTSVDINNVGWFLQDISEGEGDPEGTLEYNQLYVNYTTNSPDVIAAFGAHLASPNDWDYAAEGISGKSFHFGCEQVTASGGCAGGAINLDAFKVISSVSAPELTLMKNVTNNHGGNLTPANWNLTASDNGDVVFQAAGNSGISFVADVGVTYTLSESDIDGYAPTGDWICDGGDFTAPNMITLSSNDKVTCSIENADLGTSLTVIKTVNNNNGGTATSSNFTMNVDAVNPSQSSFPGSASGTTISIDAGAFNVTEDTVTGYTQTGISGCTGTAELGQNYTCTITNTDNPISLTVVKTVTNSNGGTLDSADFTMNVDNPLFGSTSFAGNSSGTTISIDAGATVVTEDAETGYTGDGGVGSCDFTAELGQNYTCTITNTDNPISLTVVKTVTNSNGGTLDSADFTMNVDNPLFGSTSFAGNSSGTTISIDAGATVVTEDAETGYTGDGGVGSCDFTAELGQNYTCTITNTDNPISLTVVKTVTNSNGGTLDSADFTMNVDNPLFGSTSFAGNSSGTTISIDAGATVVTEDAETGYTGDGGVGSCDFTAELGQNYTCTITNTDNPISLTVVKTVTNSNGGTLDSADFTMNVDNPLFGSTSFAGNSSGTTISIDAGATVVTEDAETGYTGDGGVGSCDFTAELGQNYTCTITNTDNPISLTVVKTVTNSNGGTLDSADFTMNVDNPLFGSTSFAGNSSGTTISIDAGATVVTEDAETGYTGDGGVGSCDFTAELGQNYTCTITNTDNPISLTVVKTVTNSNGGTLDSADFTMNVDNPLFGSTSFAGNSSGTTISIDAGATVVTEDAETGYTGDGGVGSCDFTAELGQNYTCTITNTDNPISLTVVKTVTNSNGGTLDSADFTMNVDNPLFGSTSFAGNSSGTTISIDAGATVVTEDAETGYTGDGGVGSCDFTAELGQNYTCTITNTDNPISLTVVKTVTNSNGGTLDSADFTMNVDNPLFGSTSFAGNSSGTTISIDAGATVVTEDAETGYTGDGGVGSCDFTAELGQNYTCTITNTDNPISLTVVKTVTNSNGGTLDASAFTMNVDAVNPSQSSFPGSASGTTISIDAGAFNVTEDTVTGYTQTGISGCTGTAELGQNYTCTITNTDNPISLTVVKTVTNSNGGTLDSADFTMNVDNPLFGSTSFAGNSSGTTISIDAGATVVTEDAETGYTGDGGVGSCDFTAELGQNYTCTITNTDNPISLTVVKTVTNSNGGTLDASAFTMNVDAVNPSQSSFPGSASGTTISIDAGAFNVTEDTVTGYTQTGISGCTGTAELGQNYTCTITNNDDIPSLTLEKIIINDHGGKAKLNQFTLTATGPTSISGINGTTTNDSFEAGVYVLEESGPFVDDYNASLWSCIGATDFVAGSGTLTIGLGDDVTCTITNDDRGPGLTLIKELTTDNGGTATEDDFELTASGPTGFSGNGTVSSDDSFEVGTYNLSEAGPTGYTGSDWECIGGTQDDADTITLELGESATCTITNNDDIPSLTLIKELTTDNGGTATEDDFELTASGPTGFSGNGTVSSDDSFEVGTYNLSEAGPTGYTGSDWECIGGTQDDADTITLELGESATCTITNNDDIPSLTLIKELTTDNGGTATEDDFELTASGPTGFSGNGTVSSDDSFEVGTYNLSEAGPTGYTGSDWECIGGTQDDADTITLELGESATCTVINNDNIPGLTLIKELTTDNGGTATEDDFELTASGPTGFSGNGTVSSDDSFEVGTYNLSEAGPTGYTGSDWECIGGTQDDADTITLELGESATCTITNNDDIPSLTLIKELTTDNGGTATEDDFELTASGPTGFSGNGTVSSDDSFEVGTYNLSEAGPTGYTGSDWECIGGTQDDADTITLELGESATCTVINNDNIPGLTLIKELTTDNGGTATEDDFELTASGPTGFSGNGTVSSDDSFEVGTYNLSEAGPTGYTGSDWECIGGTQDDADTITLELGESATCTITNNDDIPSLTLIKELTTDNGGTATEDDFELTASGPTGFSGNGTVSSDDSFEVGTYNLSEAGPTGYTGSDWECIGGTQDDADTITLELGESATCTVINNDNIPGLTLIKELTTDNGGTATEDDFELTASGPTGFSGNGTVSSDDSFEVGTYNLSEAGPTGYTGSDWECIGGTQDDADTITLELGESATCTITNNDDIPSLTLIKELTTDNGGTATEDDFELTATGPTSFSGNGTVTSDENFSAGTYTLSEFGPDGYISSGIWSCEGGLFDDVNTITLKIGEFAECSISNDDAPPGLTLQIIIDNGDDGAAIPTDFNLTATGPSSFSGLGPIVYSGPEIEAGPYNLNATGVDVYDYGSWSCGVKPIDNDTVTMVLGDSVLCAITVTFHDNCPDVANPDQTDSNNDGVGDDCTPRGGDNAWDTRPTFGVSHETRETMMVDNGFTFNGNSFALTDNHHTPFTEQSIELGAVNTFAATVWADKDLKVQEFLFGVPQIGLGHLAEMRVEVWFDYAGEIEEVKVLQNTEVIDRASLSITHQKVKCQATDDEAKCDNTSMSAVFLEPLADNVMAIKAMDFKLRDHTTYLNDGFDISGDSLNPMPTKMIPSPTKGQGLIEVTQNEKYSDYWTCEDGRIFEMNSFGSFKQINHEFKRFQDSGEPLTRYHSAFGGMVNYEKERALNVFNSTTLVSELPDSFAYQFPESSDRITDEMVQEMIIQEHIAKKKMEELYDKQTRWN